MQQTLARVGRWCVCLTALLLVALVLAPSPAGAHAELVAISPADRSTVDVLPAAVQLRFSEEVTAPTAVSVTGPTGAQLAAGDPALLGDRLVQRLTARSDGPGTYTVAWQATSEDQHLVYGVSTFTVRGAGVASGTATGASVDHTPWVVGLGAGMLLLLCLTISGIARLSREPAGG